MEEARLMIETAYKALTDKKASEVTVIDIHDVSTIADYFIITNGENSPHVHALVENVQEQMYKAGFACKLPFSQLGPAGLRRHCSECLLERRPSFL